MEETRTWIVCRHVVEGLAERAILSKDLTCLCPDCKDEPSIIETADLCILDEPILIERLKHIPHNGSYHIGKNQ
jgi:hypothetical protein